MFFSDCSVDAEERDLQKVPQSSAEPPVCNVFGEGALFTPVVIALFSVFFCYLPSSACSQHFAVYSRE